MEYKQLGKTDNRLPAIGQGTMGIGGYYTGDTTNDNACLKALQLGIESGMTLIDTAEAYGAGHAEELVGQAIKNHRKKVFIASKVSPEHLTYDNTISSCEGSLRRLQTNYIDIYQIHWPNPAVPLEETLRAMEKLVEEGKIKHVGVSNFSLKQVKLANKILHNSVVSIQTEYNLFDRTAEEEILPYCKQEGISLLAYSPLDNGKTLKNSNKISALQQIAEKYDKTINQVTLRWLTLPSPVIVISKAISVTHIKENASSTNFTLAEEDIRLISKTFVQPRISIPTDRIKVDRNGLDKFVPSPEVLAEDIKNGETLKPIRVVKSASKEFDYDLVEGKVRYWAWVMAYNGKRPIEALVR